VPDEAVSGTNLAFKLSLVLIDVISIVQIHMLTLSLDLSEAFILLSLLKVRRVVEYLFDGLNLVQLLLELGVQAKRHLR
jgi:hypothetical protein